MKINEILKEENILKSYEVEGNYECFGNFTLIEDGTLMNKDGVLLEEICPLWDIIHELDFTETIQKEKLESLEKVFMGNGYSQEMIEEIKLQDETTDIEGFINNLEEEQGNWGE